MSNMSYCRFQNTAKDLADCVENWDEFNSTEEGKARLRIFKMAVKILENEGVVLDDDSVSSAYEKVEEAIP